MMTVTSASDYILREALDSLRYTVMDKLQRTLVESLPFHERVEIVKRAADKFQEIDDLIGELNTGKVTYS